MAFVSRVRDCIGEDLPNLKIEIENDLDVPMETEDDDIVLDDKQSSTSTEAEEGELVDDEEVGLDHNISMKPKPKFQMLQELNSGRSLLTYETPKLPVAPVSQEISYENRNGSFVTGVNVFDPEEQAKLNKRAARFNLDPSESKPLTEKQLKKLYKSMGIKQDDPNIRLEALHMRGTSGMDTQDIFGYFKDYGPASLEWISEQSCNVVWLDDVSAARALLGLSVQIKGLRNVPSQQDSDSDSDVDMSQPSKGNSVDSDSLSEESDAVSCSELPISIPKGSWRRGAPTPHSKCILLRFATTLDKSAPRTESQFRKFNNPDLKGYVGLISESRKRRMQGAIVSNVVFDDIGDETLSKPTDKVDETNPWGTLAKSWNHYERLKPSSKPIVRVAPLRLVSPPRLRSPSPPVVVQPHRKKLVARTKLRREAIEKSEEAARRKQSSENEQDESSGSDEWNARTKMPRMRMHADDEEIKVEKRRKKDKHRTRSRSKSPKRSKDLRQRLKTRENKTSKKDDSSSSESEEESDEVEQDDNDIPDLRIAVPADRDSPEDSKLGVRESLHCVGKVKSVLRGARTHSSGDENKHSAEEDERRRIRSSVRRHRSRSRERRHHRSQRDGTLHKSSRRHSRTREDRVKDRDLRSTIRRRSPPVRDYDSDEVMAREGQDLRSKLNKRNKTSSKKEFRPKSPLQIEIDNDEYYKVIESE